MNIRHMLVLVLGLSVIGCGLKDTSVKRAKEEDKSIQRTEQFVEASARSLRSQRASEPFLNAYAKKEDWNGVMNQASTQAAELRRHYNTKVRGILKKDDDDDERLLDTELNSCSTQRHRTRALINRLQARVKQLLDYKENAPKYTSRARDDMKKIVAMMTGKTTEFSTLSKDFSNALKTYPKKAKDLKESNKALVALRKRAERNLATAEQQLKLCTQMESNQGSACDFDALGNASTSIHNLQAGIHKNLKALQKSLKDLDLSIERTLVDLKMKSSFKVCKQKMTWDNYSDYNTEQTYDLGCQDVSQQAYEATVVGATVSSGSEHEEWIEDKEAEFEYLAKYREVTIGLDNKPKTREFWEEVDADEYEILQKNIGMAVYSKTRGQFEDDANDDPHPPGYDYVGNSNYGHWQRRSDGTSFWAFYGQYMFMRALFWPPMYYGHGYHVGYRGWNTYGSYRRSGRTYYGSAGNGGRARFGTRGTVSSRRYAKSNFRRNSGYRKYGNYTRANATTARTQRARSMRSGAGRRGRGPGRGGK